MEHQSAKNYFCVINFASASKQKKQIIAKPLIIIYLRRKKKNTGEHPIRTNASAAQAPIPESVVRQVGAASSHNERLRRFCGFR